MFLFIYVLPKMRCLECQDIFTGNNKHEPWNITGVGAGKRNFKPRIVAKCHQCNCSKLMQSRQGLWTEPNGPGDLNNLPDSDTLADEIVENSENGLESFKVIIAGWTGSRLYFEISANLFIYSWTCCK